MSRLEKIGYRYFNSNGLFYYWTMINIRDLGTQEPPFNDVLFEPEPTPVEVSDSSDCIWFSSG
jgi:hypothetical protein